MQLPILINSNYGRIPYRFRDNNCNPLGKLFGN